MTRVFAAVLLASALVYAQSATLPYTQVASVPRVVDGKGFNSFAFDPVEQRLYASSWNGLFRVDLDERNPKITGPLLRKRLGGIEIAPDSGGLFYTAENEFGYLNVRTNDPPKILARREWITTRPAYEPTRREMYVGTRGSGIIVYDTARGERASEIEVPGWYVTMLEAVPGKVFMSVMNKSGLYVIDAATHTVTPWPVKGTLVTPAYFEADPSGQYLFATYDRYVVAIDIPSATVVGRLVTEGEISIAFDPERRLLIVSARDLPDHPRRGLKAYSVGAGGFAQVAELNKPSDGWGGLESLRGGFLQHAHSTLLFWKAAPNQLAAR
jgi:hypothetical protein